MDDVVSIETLAVVAGVALLAALVVGLLPRLPIPQVVLLLAGGIVIGPDVLALGAPGDVRVLADVGSGFVFLLAGYEIDLRLFREDAGRRALVAWALSFGIAAAAGGVGELLPVLAIAVFLGSQGRVSALVSLCGVAVLAAVLGLLRRGIGESGRLADVVRAGQNETAQITLRGTIMLLLALVAITDRLHLDAVLGGAGGYVAQAAALGLGALLLVQPLLVTTVLFALPLGARWAGRRLRRSDRAWASVLSLALAAFVVIGSGTPLREGRPGRAAAARSPG